MRQISLSAIFVLLALLCACSKTGAPDCEDKDVKSRVVDIIANTNFKSMAYDIAKEITGTQSCKDIMKERLVTSIKLYCKNETSTECISLKKMNNPQQIEKNCTDQEIQKAKRMVKDIDKLISKITLSDIRATDKKDSIKKCECSASAYIPDPLDSSKTDKDQIIYSAQYTSEGLKVEVALQK